MMTYLCAFFYTYLLYNGDLSINKEFKYSADNIYNDYFYQIMLGYDCYRNIEDGLRNFLNKKNIENYRIDINTNLIAIALNHCANLIIENDSYFIFDATNMELLKKVGCFLKRINVKGLHYARLINSQDDFILNKMKFKYNLNEFLKIQKISVEYFEKNKSAFNNFYDDSKEEIKEINRLILK